MLVKLYDLPPLEPAIAYQRQQGIAIRRGMPPGSFRGLLGADDIFKGKAQSDSFP